MNKNGGGEKVLFESSADDNDPVLMGDKLYFKSEKDGSCEIYQFDITTKKEVRLTYNTYPDWNVRIAKDGSKMLIARKIKKRWRLYFMNFNSPISAEVIALKITKLLGIETSE